MQGSEGGGPEDIVYEGGCGRWDYLQGSGGGGGT